MEFLDIVHNAIFFKLSHWFLIQIYREAFYLMFDHKCRENIGRYQIKSIHVLNNPIMELNVSLISVPEI